MQSPSSPSRNTPPQISMKTVKLEDYEKDAEQAALFRRVARHLLTGKRVIIVTGAGISVSSGIPDFRSAGGLYERLGLKYGSDQSAAVRGKDFFDASFFHAEKTRPLFYRFIAELKEMCDEATPTPTHHFFKQLVEEKRVLRWYTQNIDGLEERVGLETTVSSAAKAAGVPVVGLHGTLARMSCTVCKSTVEYGEQHGSLKKGKSPDCGACQDRIASREERGQRRIRGGVLRPDIVLYNEPHPQGDIIADYLSSDLAKRPTMLLVVGTSLKVVGLKRMIKDIAKAVHTNNPDGGLVVYLNKTEIQARSEWRSVFDVELVGECDGWTERFLAERPEVKPAAKPAQPAAKTAKAVAKTTKIESFFKHVKSSSTAHTSKKLANKENLPDNLVEGPVTRSKARQLRSL